MRNCVILVQIQFVVSVPTRLWCISCMTIFSRFSHQYKICIPEVYPSEEMYRFGLLSVHAWYANFDKISVRALSLSISVSLSLSLSLSLSPSLSPLSLPLSSLPPSLLSPSPSLSPSLSLSLTLSLSPSLPLSLHHTEREGWVVFMLQTQIFSCWPEILGT